MTEFIEGCISGLAKNIIGHPLDTLKVMAGIIHTSFMAGTVTGVGLNPQVGATIPAPVVAKLI